MKKNQIIILILVMFFTFFLVFTPHFTNPFPIHIDEWHHITESIKLKQGDIAPGLSGSEVGFHFILAVMSFFINLVTFYRFLPAFWAVISALVLFWVVWKTSKNFFIAVFSMIFFISLKSNVNILGLWFFVPLTFSIPFIFLYVYFFKVGVENESRKHLLLSLGIMVFLLFVHSISVLFAIPFLLIYSLFNFKSVKNQYKVFLWFLLIPFFGLLFFKFLTGVSFVGLFQEVFNALLFKRGWGVLEAKNSFFEFYSFAGFLLAFLGLIIILFYKEKRKKYLLFVIWPLSVLASIFIFRVFGVSFLSPYQRNLYYFGIALPFLSAFGLFYVLRSAKVLISGLKINKGFKKNIYNISKIIIIVLVLFFAFKSYFFVPSNFLLYKALDNDGLETLKFLAEFPGSKVMAPISISPAVFPVSGHEPVGTIFFYGSRADVEGFFISEDCILKNTIIVKHDVSYVLSDEQIDCDWNLIYYKNNYFIYKFGK
jgi:hypothetical protein